MRFLASRLIAQLAHLCAHRTSPQLGWAACPAVSAWACGFHLHDAAAVPARGISFLFWCHYRRAQLGLRIRHNWLHIIRHGNASAASVFEVRSAFMRRDCIAPINCLALRVVGCVPWYLGNCCRSWQCEEIVLAAQILTQRSRLVPARCPVRLSKCGTSVQPPDCKQLI
jgi:hypothetical protein